MNSRSSSAPHAPIFVRQQAVLHVLLVTGIFAACLSSAFPWLSREVSASVLAVQQLHRPSGPFAAIPTDASAHVFAGMNAR